MKNYTKIFAALLTAGIFLFSISVKAQSFDVGTSAINLGIGFGYSYDYYVGGGASSTPVISGSYEYGVTKLGPGTLGIGLQIGYQGASYTSPSFYDFNYVTGAGGYYTYTSTWTTTLFGIRGVYHPDFCNGKKYDVYAALQLSYDHFGYSYSSNDPYNHFNYGGAASSSFYPYIIVGGRYYFTNTVGVFAELGYSLAYLNIGLSLKFGNSAGSK